MKPHIIKRFRNAFAAFHPHESNYRLQIGKFGEFNVAYRGRTADDKVIAHSFDNDIFFAGAPEIEPANNAVVIDVGAHIGTFSLLAASKAPAGRIYAIEASLETFNYLRVNAALNPELPISVHHLALSDRDGEITLHHDRKNWGHSTTKRLSGKGERVPAMSLASFIASAGLRNIDLIKFNCEGAEFPIIMTTPPEIFARVKMMLVLYHLDLVENQSLDALLERLRAAGFACETRNQDQFRGWIVARR